MKSPTVLWSILAEELGERCCASATKDIETVLGRVEHEGLSFLTITLPSYGKDFQKSLDQGYVNRNLFQGFSWKGGLPQFLGGFLDSVFNRASGTLLNDPSIEAIYAIRQLTLAFGKVLLPCSDARVRAAMDAFIQCEDDVKQNDASLTESDYSDFLRISSLLFSGVFSIMDRKVHDEDVIPKHGPGATADKLMGNQKYQSNVWTSRLQEVFSYENFLLPNPKFSDPDEVNIIDPGAEVPVKVTPVPKTLKTPRIIAIEPTCMQYAQQAILEPLVLSLENDSYLKNFLGFSDQGPNQVLAQRSSKDGNLATLDLSEASDRVSNQLVRTMLRRFPSLLRGVDACRSRKASVPGKGVYRLSKFASMGSALCFPFEAMVFLTLIFLGIEKERNVPFRRKRDFRPYFGQVRVYGDDLIVPTKQVHSVISSLEHFGARVGESKSFWTGKFRESCGKEYYDGEDVSIVRFRRLTPTSRKDAPGVISLVNTRNQFYLAGAWRMARELDSSIRKILKYYPVVEESSPVLGRISFLGYVQERYCDSLHRPLVKGYVVRSVLPRNSLEGSGALLKFFLKRGGQPSVDRRHLERSGRPLAVDIKPRWAPPY